MSPLAGLAAIPSGRRTSFGSTANVSTSRSMNNRPELPSASAGPAVIPIEKNSGTARAAKFFFMSPPRVGWPAKNDYTTFPPANTLRGSGIPLHRALRRDRDSTNRVPRDRLCDETRGLHVLGELTEIFRAGGPSLGRAHRLLHGGKAALEHARPRKACRVGGKARLEPGEHFQLVLHENIVRTLNPLNGRRAVCGAQARWRPKPGPRPQARRARGRSGDSRFVRYLREGQAGSALR